MSPAAEKPLPAEGFERLLRSEAPAFGLEASEPDALITSRARYLAELDRWRRSANLTGRLTAPDLVHHALESALVLPAIPRTGRLVDVGSGNGLPGVPIAILRPRLSVVLVEPRQKRAAFLRHVVRELGLNAEVRRARAEDIGERFDAATVRALRLEGALADAPFLRSGGRLFLWRAGAAQAPVSTGFSLVRTIAIPGSRPRTIAVYEKTG